MIDNPDPSTWAEGAFNIIASQRKVFSEQKMSSDVRDNELIEQDAFGNELGARVEILSTTAIIDLDIEVSGKNLISATANDDGSKGAAMARTEAMKTYQEALERKYPSDIADIHMIETLRQADKERIAVLMNQGRFDDAETLTNQTKGLTAQDKKSQLDIIDRARTRAKNKARTTEQFIQDAAMTDMVAQLIDAPDDIGANELEQSRMSKANQQLFATAINKRIAALKVGNADPWLEHDNIIANAISATLEGTREEVQKVPVSDIIKHLGEGLTPEDVAGFIELRTRKLDRTDILNHFAVSEAIKHVNNLEKIGTLIPVKGEGALTRKLKEENAQAALDIRTAFKAWATANAEAITTGKISTADVTAKMQDLTRPIEDFLSREAFNVIRDFGKEETRKFKTTKAQIEMIAERFPETIEELKRNVSLILAASPKPKKTKTGVRLVAEKYYNRHIGRFE